jgi:hypothetical protein
MIRAALLSARSAIFILRSAGLLAAIWITLMPAVVAAPSANELSPQDFAYRIPVVDGNDSAAYRVSLPLAVYQKIAHSDLADLRVFNGSGEAVPFALQRPATGTLVGEARPLPVFPLKDASTSALDAVRVTIESGKGAINVQTVGQPAPTERVSTYLLDARASSEPIAALVLQWPEDAGDFAGRIRIETSDDLGDWRVVSGAAPIASLQSNGERLTERRAEVAPTKAKYWRLSWVGPAAPFVLDSVLAEPGKQSVDARRTTLTVSGKAAVSASGEFEFDLGASPPVDRVNLELPEVNTVVEIELLSRARPADPWRSIRRGGFYRLKSSDGELRNGPLTVATDTDRYWLVRTDRRGGGLGSGQPQLSVAWLPHEVVFVARGAPPFSISYGNAIATSTAVSLAAIPNSVSVGQASLGAPELVGGEARLRAPDAPYQWKTPVLWTVLIAGAGLLGWMASRLSRDL